MPDETQRKYLYVGIDRATRWVYLEILPDKSARSARTFLKRLLKACPLKIKTILTDNGKEFTDRFSTAGERRPTGNHLFDQVCTAQGIEHRLIKPGRPQTNGMVERFNGRIAEILKRTRFHSSLDLAATLERYGHLYNQHLPQKALGHVAPLEKLKQYYQKAPELFLKRPVNRPGPNI